MQPRNWGAGLNVALMLALALTSWGAYELGQTTLGTAGRWQIFEFTDGGIAARPLAGGSPDSATLSCMPCLADFDADGHMEWLTTEREQALILVEGQVAWQSPSAWRVVQANVTDFDRNHLPEAALLVWRPFQPWPIDRYLPHGGRIAAFHNAAGQSCHLVLIGWQRGRYREVWAGSALADPLLAFTAADVNGDGFQELLALETRYDDPVGVPAWALSAWEWHGFGFRLLGRVRQPFTELQVAPQGAVAR